MRALQVTRHGSRVSAVPPALRRAGFQPFGRDVADAVHAELLRWLAEGRIRPVVGRRVPVEAAGSALLDHEARRTTGRTVVLVAA